MTSWLDYIASTQASTQDSFEETPPPPCTQNTYNPNPQPTTLHANTYNPNPPITNYQPYTDNPNQANTHNPNPAPYYQPNTNNPNRKNSRRGKESTKWRNQVKFLQWQKNRLKKEKHIVREVLTGIAGLKPPPCPPRMDPKTDILRVQCAYSKLHAPGGSIFLDFITEDEEKNFLALSWDMVGGQGKGNGRRPTCQFGWRVNLDKPKSPLVPPRPGAKFEDMPTSIYKLLARILEKFVMPDVNCETHGAFLLNAYRPPQGIFWHTDHGEYDDMVCVLSLGGYVTIVFRHKVDKSREFHIFVPARSLFFFWGELRWDYEHSIEKSASNPHRVSYTYRTVKIGTDGKAKDNTP